MAAHVLRLRLDLLLGALRGDRRHVIRTLIGLAIVVLTVTVVWLAAAHSSSCAFWSGRGLISTPW